MTLVLAFLASHLGWVVSGITLLVGLFAGHKIASSAAAGKVQAAQKETSDAKGEAEVAKATVVAVSSADDAKSAAQAVPDADLDKALKDRGALRD